MKRDAARPYTGRVDDSKLSTIIPICLPGQVSQLSAAGEYTGTLPSASTADEMPSYVVTPEELMGARGANSIVDLGGDDAPSGREGAVVNEGECDGRKDGD